MVDDELESGMHATIIYYIDHTPLEVDPKNPWSYYADQPYLSTFPSSMTTTREVPATIDAIVRDDRSVIKSIRFRDEADRDGRLIVFNETLTRIKCTHRVLRHPMRAGGPADPIRSYRNGGDSAQYGTAGCTVCSGTGWIEQTLLICDGPAHRRPTVRIEPSRVGNVTIDERLRFEVGERRSMGIERIEVDATIRMIRQQLGMRG